MNTPTQEQFQTVIDTLKAANEEANKKYQKAPVYMREGGLNKCGSPMCHGGWYAIQKGLELIHSNFKDGARLMAYDLGFEDEYDLRDWAKLNSEIWGNAYGDAMFGDGSAFGDGSESDKTITDLQQIIDHWEQVKQRAAKLSN